jgi:hypothetical protein
MPEWHGEQIVETTTEARQGVTGQNVRYVLVWSTVGVIVAFLIVCFLFLRWPVTLLRLSASALSRSAVTSVHMTVAMEVTMSEQLKTKIVNPEAHFDKPKDVVQDDALSHQEKKKALNTWEQDERQLLTASNEGMPGSDEGQRKKEANRLGEVVQAKDQIGEKPKHKPSH